MSLPRRWLVLGAGGAGKSQLAVEMGRITGLPVIHLDRHNWHAGWVPTPKDEWARKVAELIEGDEWIVDGNYSGTLHVRLPRAQAAVLLDLPPWTCIAGLVRRWLAAESEPRPDIPEGCPERIDLGFLWWVASYPWRSRPRVLRRIAAYPQVELYRLRSRREADDFLGRLERPARP